LATTRQPEFESFGVLVSEVRLQKHVGVGEKTGCRDLGERPRLSKITVVESCRQQKRDVLAFLTDAVQASRGRTRPPTLIPSLTSAV
jgi:hypothetical protein